MPEAGVRAMTTTIDAATDGTAVIASPDALLRAAVSGGQGTEKTSAAGKAADTEASVPTGAGRTRPIDALMIGVAGAGIVLGAVLGAAAAVLAVPERADHTGAALTEVRAGLESHRLEAAGLAVDVDRLGKSLTALRESAESARGEARTRGVGLIDRMGKVEQALTARIVALGERIDQAEHEQGARLSSLAAQAERRPAAAASPSKVEPGQTGSITEAKPKPTPLESWAVRDVYDGTAMLEDRRRRLIEVAAGDTIPGVGRVEAVERRGRDWVVVTRQGVITHQPW
ncbi:hypothetical protein [uncultured Methylobacterium sp.]|uniref:hypothetical protein n=1 Tax=uncultured Methylobacterium sp. TaxID=157278 RepID=UPI0035CB13A1